MGHGVLVKWQRYKGLGMAKNKPKKIKYPGIKGVVNRVKPVPNHPWRRRMYKDLYEIKDGNNGGEKPN